MSKFVIVMDENSGWIGVASESLYEKSKDKCILLIDLHPEPTYFQVKKAATLVLGWIEATNSLLAFQRMPRTFHELSVEARVNLGFLPKGSDSSYFASRGIKRSGAEV